MSGKKGRSGRLPRAVELARSKGKDDALSCVRRRTSEILQVLVDKALAGDKECAIYLTDRVMGKPRIELDQRTKADIQVTPDPSMTLEAVRQLQFIEAAWSIQKLPAEDQEQPSGPVDAPTEPRQGLPAEHKAFPYQRPQDALTGPPPTPDMV